MLNQPITLTTSLSIALGLAIVFGWIVLRAKKN